VRRPKHAGGRSFLRRAVSAWVALSTLGVGMLVLATSARAATQYDAINMTVDASSIHIVGNSNAFPNFRTGAVDNSYAFAHSHVDGSPFSQGRSSPLDTGPFAQLQAASNGFQQPQYADVRFPPANSKPQEFCFAQLAQQASPGPCTRGVGYAQAFARENYAFAQANEVGDTGEKPQTTQSPNPTSSIPGVPSPAPSSGSGSTAGKTTLPKLVPIAYTTPVTPLSPSLLALNKAIVAWRARYLTADDAARFPVVLAAASTPDGADGMASVTEANFDPATGILTQRGDSRVARVSLGSGAIVLHGVHTLITMTDDGSGPQAKTIVEIAGAEVGGVPVTIGPNGVSVAGNEVPGLGDGIQQASAQLNTALAQSGWTLTAIKPNVTQSLGQRTIDATAVTVKFVQPPVAPGVPTEYFDLWIGQVFADQLGSVSTALPGGGNNLGGGGSSGIPGSSQFIPGTQGTSGTPGSIGGSGSSTNQSGLAHLLKTKPMYLLLLYFLWQSLIIGTGASLWWLKMGGKPA
jgi:hypothetical protein